MGSSSSSQKQQTLKEQQQQQTKGEQQHEQQPLLGSSTPPKGLPERSTKQGSSNITNGTSKSVSNGTQNTTKATVGAGNDGTATTAKGSGSARTTVTHVKVSSEKRDVKSRQESANRPKSMRRKTLVKQMERGVEDEEGIESILGLDRMMTKMQLKREKSRMRRPTVSLDDGVEHRSKPANTFVKAAEKLIAAGVHKFDGPKSKLEQLYLGNVLVECPSTVKIVRIFTSSTFTDTEKERNELMIQAYPRITTFCQELGYEFQVVDMRWGIRDEATDDHIGTEICLREIEMCQKLSTGPNFVSLLSQKYGYTSFPRSIEASEYEEIMGHIEATHVLDIFKKWYDKDTNSVPPAYIASRISSQLPDFKSQDKEKRDVAKKQWWAESELMQTNLEEVALKIFDAEKARKYVRSVTETEVTRGLLEVKDVANTCLWIKRTIPDLDGQDCSYLVSRYTECQYNNTKEKCEKVKEMLSDLRDVKMTKKLPAENILKYEVKWNEKEGISPTTDHKAYLTSVCEDFVKMMCSKIKHAIQERNATEDPLVHEIAQQVQFCQEKCQTFHGREGVLQKVKTYVLGVSTEPLVLHGVSGFGKTSIVAMVAKEAWNWTNQKSAIVFRFIGTTPDSSTLTGLLSSITSQISKAYNTNLTVSKDMRTLIDEFQMSLCLATSDRPLLLIIDSLDMLDPSNDARQLQWLPYKLRPHVKIIVSTLTEPQYEAFPVLQSSIKAPENFIEIPKLPDNAVNDIINKWLQLKNRQLTKDQAQILIDAFKKCPTPLFLKLSFDKASTWTSFAPKESTVLEHTVRASIENLFERMEDYHGHLFVSRALGYLTAARSGLSETELRDILSCDDDVLNDVYMYWTPPIRRLPPLLLVRLRGDLEEYLANRRVDNVHVTYWYHRQFIEAAQARYCNKPETNKMLHAALADFFQGVWADGTKKPFINKKGVSGAEDRHVTGQPVKFGNAYNLRQLNNLPYHRTKAGQLDILKKESLCNIEFLLNKLKATSLWVLTDDFDLAVQTFPEDKLLTNIKEVLDLSQEGLMYDPYQLIPQILGRMTKTKATEEFLKDCITYPSPCILPNKRILTEPGGQLVQKMAGHRGEILSLDLTRDSSKAITSGDDSTIRIWDVKTGKQLRMLDGLGKVSRGLFCNNDTSLLIDTNQSLTVHNLVTGEKVFDISAASDEFPSCLVGDGKVRCVVFKELSAAVYDLKHGSEEFKLELTGDFEFKFPSMSSGSKNYAAVTTGDQISLAVLDLRKKQFTPMFRGFEPFADAELGETIQYEIDELAIMPDERHVIYSNIYTNDIVFLDFKAMKKTRVVKGNPNDYVRSLKCSPDGKFIHYVKAAFLTFLNVHTSDTKVELEHTVDVKCAVTNDLRTVVTIAEDSNVRVFDRTRKEHKMSNTPGVSANRIRMVFLHPNPRYLVGFGFKTREADSQFIFVYDLVKNSTVREKLLDSSLLQIQIVNDDELLVLHDVEHKLKVVSLDKLEIVREFQGYLPDRMWNFKYIGSRKEVVCLSRGRSNIKVYDYTTGKTVAVLDNKQAKLDGFTVSESGTCLVAWCDDEVAVIQIYDLSKRRLTKTINNKNASFSGDEIKLSPDGKLLLYTAEAKPTGSQFNMEETILEVWDTQKGSRVSECVDIEYHNKYITSMEKGESSAVDSFTVLDDKQVLVAHDDYIVRLFDMRTGSLVKRMFGHKTGVEIVYSPISPYILTYGAWEEENSLRVWNKTTMECMTSYTMDRTATQLNFSQDSHFILGVTGKPAEIVIWNFNNFEQTMAIRETKYPETFAGQNTSGGPYLDLVPEDETIKIDPSDLDQDLDDDISDDDDDFM